MWNSGLEDTVIRPIADKAILAYADKLLKQKNRQLEVKLDGYEVKLIRNNVLHNELFPMIFPEAKEAHYMINVEVGIPSGKTIRWYVGIYYKFEKGKWIEENSLKELTSMERNK